MAQTSVTKAPERHDQTHEDGDADVPVGVNCRCRRWVDQRSDTQRSHSLFGCHIGVMNRNFGGERGKSSGKDSRALKKPPSLWGT